MSAKIPSNTPSQLGWWHMPFAELIGRAADWFHLAFRSDDKKVEWIMAQFTASQSFPSRRNRDWAEHHLASIQHRISQKNRFLSPGQEATLLKVQKIIRETFRSNSSEGVPIAQTLSFSEESEGVRTPKVRDEDLQSRVSDYVNAIVRESGSAQGGELALRFQNDLMQLPDVEGVSPDRVREQIIRQLLVTDGVQQRLLGGMEANIQSLVMKIFARYSTIEELKKEYHAMHGAFMLLSPQLAEEFQRQFKTIVKKNIDSTSRRGVEWENLKEFKGVYADFILLGDLERGWPMFQTAIEEKAKRWLSENESNVKRMAENIRRDVARQGEYIDILNEFPSWIKKEVMRMIFT